MIDLNGKLENNAHNSHFQRCDLKINKSRMHENRFNALWLHAHIRFVATAFKTKKSEESVLFVSSVSWRIRSHLTCQRKSIT